MRLLMIACLSVSVLALIPGAFAQTAQHPSPPNPSVAQDDVEHQHPDWFKEPDRYRPCPANVEFPGGRHTCLDVGK